MYFITYLYELIQENIISIFIAFLIILAFRILCSSMSYLIIRVFKFKIKNRREITESAFYKPLKVFFMILGVYIAILYLREPFSIDILVMKYIETAFIAISILVFTKGLASSFRSDSIIGKKLAKKFNKEPEDFMFNTTIKIIRVLIYITGIIILVTLLGFDLTGLIAGLGISGVIITLAAQDTAKNLLGGAMIFADRPFKVGDWIQIDGYEGTVENITFRSTRIRTFENALVNIPNGNVSNLSITNWSEMEKRRYKTNLCVEIDTPLQKLEDCKVKIEEMLKSRKAIIDDSVIVKFDLIKQDGLNILIYSFLDAIDYVGFLTEKEDINYKIVKILEEEKVKLAYDTKTIKIKN